MVDITFEYNDLKINIQDIENISNKQEKKNIDDKINEALENFNKYKNDKN